MPALAIRTSLRVDALDAAGLAAAASSNADAVVLDVASAAAYLRRADARRAANRAAEVIAAASRPVHARVSDYRSGATEGDIQATVRANLAAVVLAAVERPQDARDIDVAIRKQEMRRGIEPGSVRLVAEVSSAAGFSTLAEQLAAIDRHSAVVLDVDALAADLRLPGPHSQHLAMLDHVMGEVALICAAAGVAWTLAAPVADSDTRANLATRAHAHGATGVVLASESEASGFNSLFAPDAEAVANAHLVVAEWDALFKRGEESGVVAGQLVDRRAMRRARALIEQADAIAARERR